MTTIPQAAVDAAAKAYFDSLDIINMGYTWEDYRDEAETILAAALPLLGEQGTEYTIQITSNGHTSTMDDNANTDRLRSETFAAERRDECCETAVVQRTVTRTEWTEVDK